MPNAGNIPDFFEWAAQQHNLDPALVARVVHAESSGNPNAVSPKGATGLMQLMPGTAKEMGVMNVNDPVDNYLGGIKYLDQNKRQFGTDEKALAAYNFGPGHVARGDAYPKETQDYIAKIMGPQGQQTQSAAPDFLEWASQQQQPPPTDEGYSVEGFLGNVMKSGQNMVEGVAQTVMHPIDTISNVVQHPGAIIDHYAERLKHPIDTLYNDPIGAAFDIAGLVAPAARMAGLGKVAEVAEAVNPLNAVAKPAAMAGKSLYGSVLKPSRALRAQAGMTTGQMAELGLNEGALIAGRGADKLDRLATATAQETQGVVDRAAAAGQSARPGPIGARLQDVMDKMHDDITPAGKQASVNATWDEFLDKFTGVQQPGQTGFRTLRDIPVDELQRIKKTSYEYTPNNAWISESVPPATREARMALTNEIKQEIERLTQGYEQGGMPVKDLNKRYADLRSLEEAITTRTENPNGSLRHLAEVGGSLMSGHPGGLLAYLFDNPRNLSAAAQIGWRAPAAAKPAASALALMRALSGQ